MTGNHRKSAPPTRPAATRIPPPGCLRYAEHSPPRQTRALGRPRPDNRKPMSSNKHTHQSATAAVVTGGVDAGGVQPKRRNEHHSLYSKMIPNFAAIGRPDRTSLREFYKPTFERRKQANDIKPLDK